MVESKNTKTFKIIGHAASFLITDERPHSHECPGGTLMQHNNYVHSPGLKQSTVSVCKFNNQICGRLVKELVKDHWRSCSY